ncbi:MAG: hypothetical protein CMQ41_04550 [Gammaproteobacteria bacterium]|nr:hypothetical protein [Gammaproteobacteria bacterium]|tara:strand:- start:432 stop:893 length:462 start_codon:yes stop_codon:yes gene_type:complete
MQKVSLDTWVQLLGMVGVLGGLIFVGLEMQQTQRIALANQQQARTELVTEMMLVDMELIGELGIDSGLNSRDWSQMNPQEKALREARQNYLWQVLENNFFQKEMGLLTPELWEQVERYNRIRWSECNLRHTYNRAIRYQPFTDYLDELPDPCE